MNEYRELLLGCGHRHGKLVEPLKVHGRWELHKPVGNFSNLTTLDISPRAHPDLIGDLASEMSLPFEAERFDEIHAYEVLEHLGAQGDSATFLRQFSDYWRILKPRGLFVATVPMWNSIWAWGDPSHRRIINRGTLTFLSQLEYQKQAGKTPMSDFRAIYHADFELIADKEDGDTYIFALEAIKPPRLETVT